MRWAASVAAALAACAGPPAGRGAPRPADEVPPADTRPFTIWFEPPRAGPGELTVVHESGHRHRGPAGATGATVPLLDGPCTVTLVVGDETFELVLVVAPGAREHVWELAPPR